MKIRFQNPPILILRFILRGFAFSEKILWKLSSSIAESLFKNKMENPGLDIFKTLTKMFPKKCQTQDWTKSKPFIENLKGSIFAWLFGCSGVCHGGDSSDVTLAFEDAQVIQTLMDDEWCIMDDGW